MPGRSWRIFGLFGINVSVHFSLVFALILFTLLWGPDFSDFLDRKIPQMRVSSNFLGFLLSSLVAVLAFASVLAHEFSHSLLAKLLGMRVLGITLFALGGLSDIDKLGRATPKKSLFISLAGPLASLGLSGIFLFVLNVLDGARATPLSASAFLVVIYLVYINFSLAVFNLIPAFPLDGGRIFLAALQLFGVGERKAQNIASFTGIVVGCLFVCAGLAGTAGILPLPRVNSLWLMVIAVFLITANISERRQQDGKEYP
jgi:Zn-dependent protease